MCQYLEEQYNLEKWNRGRFGRATKPNKPMSSTRPMYDVKRSFMDKRSIQGTTETNEL